MSLVADVRGDGMPVVCLPWFSLDAAVLAAALEPALAARLGLRRIYLDLPGCGRSPAGPTNSDGVLAAVLEYIDRQVGPAPFLLAGCSYGGYLAAALARHRPEQVAGLLLICAGVKIREADRDLPPAPEPYEGAKWLVDVPPDLRGHLSLAIGNRTRQGAGRVAAVLGAARTADDKYLQLLRETGYQLSDEDSTASYAGPATILAGRQDYIVGYADQFRALTGFPNATYVVLADAGHYLPLEQPDFFRELTLDWLDRCPVPSPGGNAQPS